MVAQLFSKLLEQAINRYLALDPDAKNNLSSLDGKVVELRLRAPAIRIYLVFSLKHVAVQEHYSDEVDVVITSSVRGLLSMARSSDAWRQEVELQGDSEMATAVHQLFTKLDIDWEEHLSQLCGDVLARKISNVARGAWQWRKQVHSSFQQSCTEYLQEELAVVPTRSELEAFYTEVAELRNAVERAEARIQVLKGTA